MTREQAWAAAIAPHAFFAFFLLLTLREALFQFLFVYSQSVNKNFTVDNLVPLFQLNICLWHA